MTQNQLQELLESDPVRALVEASEEQGFIEATTLETFGQEHELNEADLEQLRTELVSIGFEIQAVQTGWITGKAGKAFEVLLERFAGCFYLKLW